jgi:hypothetical protein
MGLTLVVLAAGTSTRFGALKQLEPVGPSGEALMDYGIYDAIRAGCSKIVIVVRREIEHLVQEHVEPRFAHGVDLAFPNQSLQDIPVDLSLLGTRSKPWGTAHAILSARHEIEHQFIVCNADDFYGAESYRMLAEHLAQCGDRNSEVALNDYALVGHRLRDTLSSFGGVTRAVCKQGAAGFLEGLIEVDQIREREGWLSGTAESGDTLTLAGSETVSMNLWGFTSAVVSALEHQFHEFLTDYGTSLDREFLIPAAVNQQIERRLTRVKVLTTPDHWIGMTFTQDKPRVVEHIAELVRRGVYPARIAFDSGIRR